MKKHLPPVFARVRNALRRRGSSTQDSEDIVQEAWVRLTHYEREREAVADPEPFMMRIALNLSIDAHRMRVHHGEEVLAEEVVLADTAPSVEAVVLGRERLARLHYCLGRLTERSRDIFLAHRLDGLTYREIADQHGLSISTVEKHIAKVTMQLITGMQDWRT
ncbi:RNA polymerase sigma factor [Paucibacter sp. M5-1]|uniref:RNA polymerase sigma factor n=1 Tax=Paucibacter sp. M5-1 TaxID=3015998 RepID=UPI0022B8EC30|nr:sigma-70 family RNA polymerase sigma factor [Paucibacter sp. M5-1]MCZ7881909.1 sigma-70 family RNA polymerase sigma factor [Paucibacter sp. M5-1]